MNKVVFASALILAYAQGIINQTPADHYESFDEESFVKSRLQSLFETGGSGQELQYTDEKGGQVKCVLNGDINLIVQKDEAGNQMEKNLV